MSPRRHRLLVVALSLALAPIAVADSQSVNSAAECTISTEHFETPQTRWREVSRASEAVSAQTRTARRRPVHRAPDIIPRTNFIDGEIFAAMETAGVEPTRLTTDEEFLRRVSLDLTGAIPTADEVRSFVGDTASDKRSRAIDVLLDSEGYVDRWTLWFGDLVQNVRFSTNVILYSEGRNAYYLWIRKSFEENKPYDVMVRELVNGSGDNFESGPANYIVRQRQPNGPPQDTYDNLAANSGQKFLAMPFECLSCHSGPGHLEMVNSYLSTRERQDFWSMAAFFARVGARGFRDDTTNRVHFLVSERLFGGYVLDTTTGNKSPREPLPGDPEVVDPKFFFGGGTPVPGETRRQAFGRLLTSDRQFARATVNYIWKELFHLGIVEPADSFDLLRLDPDELQPGAELQPTHPVLLERLADELIDSGYDLKSLMRLIAESSAYQLATDYTPGEWDESWTPTFARHYAQRLHAEILLDAICSATSLPATFNVQYLEPFDKAIKLPDPLEGGGRRNPHGLFMDAFGRGDRDDTPRTSEGSILQALHLMNDIVVTLRVRAATPGSRVQTILGSTDSPATIVEDLYLSTLSRHPTSAELADGVALLESSNAREAAEDLQFSLINRLEFMFN